MNSAAVSLSVTLSAALLLSACAAERPDDPRIATVQTSGPLRGSRVMAFATTRDATACRTFYEGVLGLRVLTDDPMALVLDSGGTIIRIQKIPSHEPEQFTVLGWTTPDIRATVARLNTAGVAIERYEWMSMQDQSGVATFPGGDMVAWFKDPDGNILSVAQLK